MKKRLTAFTTKAAAMQTAAATDGDAIKASMAQLGSACSGCHKAYRQPES